MSIFSKCLREIFILTPRAQPRMDTCSPSASLPYSHMGVWLSIVWWSFGFPLSCTFKVLSTHVSFSPHWGVPLLYYSFQIFLPFSYIILSFSYIFCHLKFGGFAVTGFIKVFGGGAFCFLCLLEPPCIGGQTCAEPCIDPVL